MRVFISWSGEQSKAVAMSLRAWLPKVLASKVEPFVSTEDIDKGSRGLDRIANELEHSDFGIVVVTPLNQSSPWINFEAGALGKSVSSGHVAPLLLGLSDPDLLGPLKQFQNASASEREAVLALVQSVNGALTSDPLPRDAVQTLFDANWTALATDIEAALAQSPTTHRVSRGPEDLLEEVLTTVRALQREVAEVRTLAANALMQAREPGYGEGSYGTAAFGGVTSTDVVDVLHQTLSAVPDASYTMNARNAGRLHNVFLSKTMPELSAETIKELSLIAGLGSTTIFLTRPDGSSLTLYPDGRESRSDPVDWDEVRREKHQLDAEIDAAYEADAIHGQEEPRDW